MDGGKSPYLDTKIMSLLRVDSVYFNKGRTSFIISRVILIDYRPRTSGKNSERK